MAFNVVFYNFSKKENSTAVPASGGTTYSCTLKDGCSIINPVIKLSLGPASGVPIGFNYCRIQNFNRYYFVNDWTSDKGMWYANLSVDVLATYKSAIGSSSELIVRSASEYDGSIVDTVYPTKNQQIFYSRSGSTAPWWPISHEAEGVSFPDRGEFIVGLLSYTGASGDLVGGVNYVGFEVDNFTQFMEYVFNANDPNSPSSIEGAAEAMRNVLQGLDTVRSRNIAYLAENPYTDYIQSITWIPITGHFGSHSIDDLWFGPSKLRISYRSVDPKEMLDFSWSTSSIPKHPQAAARGSYLNLSPYSSYQCILPRVGSIPVDPVMLGDYSTFTVELHLDQITGQGLYQMYVGDGNQVKHLINQQYAPIGVTVKIGTNKPVGTSLGMVIDAAGMATNIINDIASGNGFNPGSIRGIAGIIRENRAPGQGTIGDSGGYCGLYPGYPVLQSQHMYVTDNDVANNGAPLMKIKQISALSGYMICQHGDISVACTDTERSEIKRHLETGFFYE